MKNAIKRITGLFTAVAMLALLCACGNHTSEKNKNEKEENATGGATSESDETKENSGNPEKEKYVITYETGLKSGVTIEAKTQEVYYGEEVMLYTPTHTDYEFVKWVIEGTQTEVKSGVYTFRKNITLQAVWKENDGGDYGFL